MPSKCDKKSKCPESQLILVMDNFHCACYYWSSEPKGKENNDFDNIVNGYLYFYEFHSIPFHSILLVKEENTMIILRNPQIAELIEAGMGIMIVLVNWVQVTNYRVGGSLMRMLFGKN